MSMHGHTPDLEEARDFIEEVWQKHAQVVVMKPGDRGVLRQHVEWLRG
jgi:hypothetical protein